MTTLALVFLGLCCGINHPPTMVEDGVGICLGCERLIRWIPWFMRGDASLGYVEQDYTVETKR